MIPTVMPPRMSIWLDHAWLARYLSHQLVGDELAWFEAYMLDKPELLAVIEADTDLRLAFSANPGIMQTNDPEASTAAVEAKVKEAPAEYSTTAIGTKRRVLPAWFSLAAMLVLGAGIGVVGMRASGKNDQPATLVNPTRIVFDALRGGADAARVEHADSASRYALVEVAVPPGAEHVTLDTAGGEQALTSSPDGFVSFLAARNTLDAGHKFSIRYQINGQNKEKPLVFAPFKQE